MNRISFLLAVAGLGGIFWGANAMAQSSSSAQTSASSVSSRSGTWGSSSTYSGQITGNGVAQYGLPVRAHQQVTVTLHSPNPNTRMQIFKDAATAVPCEGTPPLHICRFQAEPHASYRVQIFLERDAAQRGEHTEFSLSAE